MTRTSRPIGLGIVGCGYIAGAYARDLAAHPEVRLVAVADLDPARATAFAAAHETRAHGSLDALLADDEVDLVVNLTIHHAHYDVTSAAIAAGHHVYSEKPLALEPDEAHALVELARQRGVRLGCSPATFLGEAQQTAGRAIADGRLGQVRAVFAEVDWGRIETWHPAPAPFYDVGVLMDVGVYPLTIATAFLGPAVGVRAWGWYLEPERSTLAGERFRIGSPDLIIAAVELSAGTVLRLTASFYAGGPAKAPALMEFHGDDGALALHSFQEFDAPVEFGRRQAEYEPLPPLREPYPGTAWGRGVVEMAQAIAEDRPHRVTGEHAAHVVDILDAARRSMAEERAIEVASDFPGPPLMDWAVASRGV
jgi:predicted dehydrogenase